MAQFKRRAQERRSRNTAWSEADWYLGMAGRHGHAYHRFLALPALLDWLELPHGARVLDIGCGPGVPAPHLWQRGLRYTGIDSSGQMIRQARAWHGRYGSFLVGDARTLDDVVDGPFDAAFFLFSLQDMQPLERVIEQAATCLKPGGLLIAVLTHPCFRVPRFSGWGWDQARQLHFRRVDRYLTPLPVFNRQSATTSFHRPLQDYFTALAQAGLAITQLRELAPTTEMLRRIHRGDQAANEDIPALLILQARRT